MLQQSAMQRSMVENGAAAARAERRSIRRMALRAKQARIASALGGAVLECRGLMNARHFEGAMDVAKFPGVPGGGS